MAALGAGAGAFTGDVEREKLRQGWAGIAQNQERIDLAADQQAYDQSWGNAIKQQDLANRQKEFQERSLRVDAMMRAGQDEDRQRAAIQRMRESSLGNAIIAGEMNGGFLKQSQLNMFNSDNQTAYDAAGMYNPVTGKSYEDGQWHFIQFKRDNNQIVTGSDGMPIVERDIPISRDFHSNVIGSQFGQMYLGRNRSPYGIGSDRLAIEKLRNKNAMDLEDKRIAGKIAVQNLRNDGKSSRSSSTRDDSLQRQKAVWDAAMRYSEYNPDISFDDAIKRASEFFGYGQHEPQPAQRPTTKGMSLIGDTLRYQDDTGNVVNVKPGGKVSIGGQDWYWDGGEGFLTAQEQAKKVLAERAANGGGATTPKTEPVTATPSATPAAADKQPKVISPVTAGATASPSASKPAANTSGKTESQKMREKNGGAMPAEKEQTGTIYSPRMVNDEAGARIEVDATPTYGQRQPMFGGGSSIDAIRKYKQGEYEKSMQEKARAAKADELNKWIDSELGDAERVNANAQVEHNLRDNPRMTMADLKRQDAEVIASEKARYAAERSDIVDRFLSNEENRRKAIARIANEKKRTDMKNKSLKEREAYARRLLSIYSSGDEDRIRKSMQDEADMYGLIEEIIGK